MSSFYPVLTECESDIANYIIERTSGQKKPAVTITGVFTAFDHSERMVLLKSGELPAASVAVKDLTEIICKGTKPLSRLFSGGANRNLIDTVRVLPVLEEEDIQVRGLNIKSYGLIAVGGYNPELMGKINSCVKLNAFADEENFGKDFCSNGLERFLEIGFPSSERTQAIAVISRRTILGESIVDTMQTFFKND